MGVERMTRYTYAPGFGRQTTRQVVVNFFDRGRGGPAQMGVVFDVQRHFPIVTSLRRQQRLVFRHFRFNDDRIGGRHFHYGRLQGPEKYSDHAATQR